jgi:N-methylhydantoinase B/oxoprolinase/acetone carboxylase alpha subunit
MNDDASTFEVEVHLQEVFSGETVWLAVEGLDRARLEARTRFQTGLADIETLKVHEGDEVTIRVDGGGCTGVTAERSNPYIVVKMIEGRLDVTKLARSPGYL